MVSDFIQAQIHSIQRQPADRPQSETLSEFVDEVAEPSVAATAGITVGDLLETIQGVPASDANITAIIDPDTTYRYEFFSAPRRERIVLECTGVPLGISSCYTNEAILLDFVNQNWEWDDLYELWKNGAWEHLEKAVTPRLTPKEPGFWGRLLGKKPEPVKTTPFNLMKGALLYEHGEHEAALPWIEAYREVEGGWTLPFMGIARFYVARDALRRGDRDRGTALLREAVRMCHDERVSAEFERATGEKTPSPDYGIGKPFPVDYVLQSLDDDDQQISLSQELAAMSPEQMLLICVLGSYRGNGPYDSAMWQYRRISRFMRQLVPNLHIITETQTRHPDRPQYFEGEDGVRESGAPFALLHDPSGDVATGLDPPGSPWFYYVSKKGTIVDASTLHDVNVWRAVGKCADGA